LLGGVGALAPHGAIEVHRYLFAFDEGVHGEGERSDVIVAHLFDLGVFCETPGNRDVVHGVPSGVAP
jgi:hypothetical protein